MSGLHILIILGQSTFIMKKSVCTVIFREIANDDVFMKSVNNISGWGHILVGIKFCFNMNISQVCSIVLLFNLVKIKSYQL